MVEITAQLSWEGRGARFAENKYSRAHVWEFDGGTIVRASSSPHVVPVPYSDPAAVDPEEAYVASLASCHMLWFLSLAAKRGYVVEGYRDRARGTMAKNASGQTVITTVTLHPHAVFSDSGRGGPSEETVTELHEAAHAACFLANSVLTEIVTRPTFEISRAEPTVTGA